MGIRNEKRCIHKRSKIVQLLFPRGQIFLWGRLNCVCHCRLTMKIQSLLYLRTNTHSTNDLNPPYWLLLNSSRPSTEIYCLLFKGSTTIQQRPKRSTFCIQIAVSRGNDLLCVVQDAHPVVVKRLLIAETHCHFVIEFVQHLVT